MGMLVRFYILVILCKIVSKHIFSVHHFCEAKMLNERLRMDVFAEKRGFWRLRNAVGGFKYVVCTSVRYHVNKKNAHIARMGCMRR